jgi:hypothetical protein
VLSEPDVSTNGARLASGGPGDVVATDRFAGVDVGLNTIQSTAPWVLLGIGVVGVVAAIVIKKVVGKIIALVLAAVLIFIGWQQRQHVIDYANSVKDETCAMSTTFVGIDVSLPESWCTPS